MTFPFRREGAALFCLINFFSPGFPHDAYARVAPFPQRAAAAFVPFPSLLFGRIVNARLRTLAADPFEKAQRQNNAWRVTHIAGISGDR